MFCFRVSFVASIAVLAPLYGMILSSVPAPLHLVMMLAVMKRVRSPCNVICTPAMYLAADQHSLVLCCVHVHAIYVFSNHAGLVSVVICLLQSLGDSCMHADKDQRPTFDQLIISLDQLQQQLSSPQEEAPPTPTTPFASMPSITVGDL